MYKEITIERLSVKSIFKLVALGLLFSFVPFFVLMGCFALFDANTLTWNNQHIHGISALIAAPFMGVFVASGFTLFVGTFMSIGLWICSKFKSLTVSVKQSTD
ncbi:MAG: hypothetical protein KA945_05680 [Zoogloea sp.]|jgi:hypothetical protein|uniref:hypothetical protein n=1 Tax=Dokdonella sp. TaxID=2291710 RepID=UPI001B6422DD|nr:hypothetical protein [Dokdonella sp.]MBP7393311.1 hypothetical protein [Zoogloea sp.]